MVLINEADRGHTETDQGRPHQPGDAADPRIGWRAASSISGRAAWRISSVPI